MTCRDFNETIKKFFPIAEFDSKDKSSEQISLVDARHNLMPGVEQNSRISKVDALSLSHRTVFVGRVF